MKILLALPPQWIWHRPYLSSPYLSLPSLSAYLKANGFDDVIQKDLNLESYDLMLSAKYLLGLKERLETRFNELDSQTCLARGIEQAFYHDLFRAKNSVERLATEIQPAKQVFKSNKYFDITELTNARKILDQALSIITAAYFPNDPKHLWATAPPFQGSFPDLKALTQDRLENPFIELFEENFLPEINRIKPDIVCLSIVNHSQLIPALTLGWMLKSTLRGAKVIVGGGVVTLLAETLKNHPELFSFFDIAVRNEGELPLAELAKCLSADEGLEAVPNIIYLQDGNISVTNVKPAININELPTPDFDGLPLDSYLTPDLILPVISSRGCYWGKCVFCANCETYQWRYQKRDELKMADDLEDLARRYHSRHFAFSDECLSPSEFNRLSNEILKRRLDIRCWAQARLESQFDSDLCNRISQAGFKMLLLGLESGCNRVLSKMNKGITKEIAGQVCRNLHDAGIWNHLYAFFGFPSETRAEAQETIDFLINNKSIVSSFNIDAFIVGSGSQARKHPERFDIADVQTGLNDDLDIAFNYDVKTGMNHAEADALSKDCEGRIGDAYDTREVMNRLAQDDVLLYLSHYEKQDPYLKSVLPSKPIATKARKFITPNSVPQINHGVVVEKLRFNPNSVGDGSNTDSGKMDPEQTYIIFDPASGTSSTVSFPAIEIISLCDGIRSIKKISSELFKRYDAPLNTLERDCIDLLKPLAAEGFIGICPV